MLTLEIMRRRWPHGDQHIPGLMEAIVASAPAVFEKYGIDKTPNPDLVVAHMMAQFSEECGQGLEMIEDGHYSASRLMQVFPTHFTAAMAQRAAGNPRLVFDIAYGGRMGNRPPPSDDGYNYCGKGLSQVTGRDGVAELQKKLDEMNAGFNVLESPELIVDPGHTLECGVADYIVCGCLPYAERDDVVGETKRLNGGLNGLDERRRQLALWKRELLGSPAPAHGILWVQQALIKLGASIQADGEDGPATQAAVKDFQRTHSLTVDGVAGPETIKAIEGLA